jgi:serine/threonine protein kinase
VQHAGGPSPVPGLTDLELVARGGYSTVYRARQAAEEREVALKIGSRAIADEEDRELFLLRAELLGWLSTHPHIVRMYEAGLTADHHPYLVMELRTGGSYADRLATHGPLPPAEVVRAGPALADALAAAHGAGILHGDVKPGNILLTADGEPGLADFGGTPGEALTPAYTAPELFRHQLPTPSADIYSLGATLYALLTGRPPRWPEVGTPSVAAVLHVDVPIADVPGVPAEFSDVLRQALAVGPEDRYSFAADFRDALLAAAPLTSP